MKKRRIISLALTLTMLLSLAAMAFADGGVTGTGTMEYDDSEAVEYDKVTVPTLTAATYNFKLDPTGVLSRYDAENYSAAASVYFSAVSTNAAVEGKDSVTLYKKEKTALTDASGVFSGVVKTIDGEGAVTALEDGPFYLWVPKSTADASYTAGKPGDWKTLAAGDIDNFFEVVDKDAKTIKFKSNIKASATTVCDGKIYQEEYVAVSGNKITDSVADPITNYVTLSADKKSVASVQALYKDNTGTVATADDLKFTAEESAYGNQSEKVVMINKSSKDKTVTATITMSNVSGLTFQNSSTFAADDEETSIYVAASNGTTTVALVAAEDGETATATYTVDIGKPTISEITYIDGTNAKTGGFSYKRYEGYGTSYNSDSFYITAAANKNAGAKEAWEEWAGKITAETQPKINIVYTIADRVEGPQFASSANRVITYNAAAVSSITKIDANLNGTNYDIYHFLANAWFDATDTGTTTKTITFDAGVSTFYPGATTVTIYYKDASNADQTSTLSVNLGA